MPTKFSIKINDKINFGKKTKLTEEEYINNSKTKDPTFTGRKNYKRISFNLPPEVVIKLREYSTKLKNLEKKDSGMSTLVAKACIQYLNNKGVSIGNDIIPEKNTK